MDIAVDIIIQAVDHTQIAQSHQQPEQCDQCLYKQIRLSMKRGCDRWGAACYGAVLAVEYVRAVLGLSRSVQGGKGYLRHLPNIKLIGQQEAKLWAFFANNAISRCDLDLWPLDLEIGPRGAGVPGILPTKFGTRRPFRFPSRWRHGTDRQTDGRTGSTHDGASF